MFTNQIHVRLTPPRWVCNELKHFMLAGIRRAANIYFLNTNNMDHDSEELKFDFHLSTDGRRANLALKGRLDTRNVVRVWPEIENFLPGNEFKLNVDLKNITYLDTAGATFLSHIENAANEICLGSFSMTDLDEAFYPVLEQARKIKKHPKPQEKGTSLSFIENQGLRLNLLISETNEFITYIGRIFWALIQSLKHPRKIRWQYIFMIAEKSGVDALPIVALISFIVGLVMAFQAAIPMRMFGAELYVANLIGISMVRELAPLMTAIVLAGRSASAFAAEIGTMRINEEIDALTVMGLDPVQYLIVPRVIAATIMTPLLTVFANLMGMMGGALVITSMGYPLISYYNQIVSFVGLTDLTGGLVKCFVFGILIAGTGCIRGYQTQSGPSAVGISTTRAVVTSIILIAVFDGIFSIVYYYLGI